MSMIICIDFDGVLHSYISGWQGAATVSDPPVPGAMEWLWNNILDPRFELHIYSSRSKDPAGVMAMTGWLKHWLTDFAQSVDILPDERVGMVKLILDMLKFPTQKPAAAMTIDDRAFCFMGKFPSLDWLANFKPWNKKVLGVDVDVVNQEHLEHILKRGEKIETAATKMSNRFPCLYERLAGSMVDVTNEPMCGKCDACVLRLALEELVVPT